MFTYQPGQDVARSDAEILVNTVNTVGVMGKGVALAMKNAFPEIMEPYERACASGRLRPGTFSVTKLEDGRRVVNLATKEHWRDPSKLEWVGSALVYLSVWLQREKPASVALPPPGCGNGGLDWARVHAMAERYLAPALEAGVDIRILGERPDPLAFSPIFAGVGSRKTPPEVQAVMLRIAAELAERGWILRSGGAIGADTAFHDGMKRAGADDRSLIYRPKVEPKFPNAIVDLREVHYRMMRNFHPKPEALTEYAAGLMARNGNQVFGPDFSDPSSCVVCWTPGGKGEGGTGQAIRLARAVGTPVFDLGEPALWLEPVSSIVEMVEACRPTLERDPEPAWA